MWLTDNQVEYEYRNILKEPPAQDELKELAGLAGLMVKELLNKKSQALKKMEVKVDELDEDGAAELILSNPRIMHRPLLTDGRKIIIGFKGDNYETQLGGNS